MPGHFVMGSWELRQYCGSYGTWGLTAIAGCPSVVGVQCGDELAGGAYSPGHPFLFSLVVVIGQQLCITFMGFAFLLAVA